MICHCGHESTSQNRENHIHCLIQFPVPIKRCPFCGERGKAYSGYGEDKVGCFNIECHMYCKAVDYKKWQTRN